MILRRPGKYGIYSIRIKNRNTVLVQDVLGYCHDIPSVPERAVGHVNYDILSTKAELFEHLGAQAMSPFINEWVTLEEAEKIARDLGVEGEHQLLWKLGGQAEYHVRVLMTALNCSECGVLVRQNPQL